MPPEHWALIVPIAIITVALIERRFGSTVSGVLQACPIVAAPLLAVVATCHDEKFLQSVAAYAIFGTVPWFVFVLVYDIGSDTLSNNWLTLAALSAWLLCAIIIRVQLFWVLAIASPFLSAGLWTLLWTRCHRRLNALSSRRAARPIIPLIALGTALAYTVAYVAGSIGDGWSGILTTFPTTAFVFLRSSMKHYGAVGVHEHIGGLVLGIPALLAFLVATASLLLVLPKWTALGGGVLVAVAVAKIALTKVDHMEKA